MHSLVLVMAFLFYALASPVLRSRVVQDVDAFGNLVTAQGNPVDLEGNLFDNVASLASANLESVGTTSDLQPYPARTDHQAANLRLMPTNFGDNINLGAPAQQDQDQPDGPIAFVDKIKQGWNPTADNPCPNLHTLCARSIQYFPLNGIKDADPCPFLSLTLPSDGFR